MDISGFFQFILLAVMVILVSVGLDRLYAAVVPFRSLYYAIRLPGVVLHEIAHMIGCVLTGAEIKKVVYFSAEGGSVTYTGPKIPVIGPVIISTAPLFFLPLILAVLTWVFGTHFGCNVPPIVPLTGDLVTGSEGMFANVITIFSSNLIVHPNGWFLVYLFVCGSIVLSLAPSGQDFKNAAIGIGFLLALCLLILKSGFGPGIALVSLIASPMITAFSTGLLFEMIAVIVALPFVVIFLARRS